LKKLKKLKRLQRLKELKGRWGDGEMERNEPPA